MVVSRVVASEMASTSASVSSLVQGASARSQCVGGRPDAGQRGPQVVRDGGQQGRAGAVACLQLAGSGGLAGSLLTLPEHAEVGGEGVDDAPVPGAQVAALDHEHLSSPGRHDGGIRSLGLDRVTRDQLRARRSERLGHQPEQRVDVVLASQDGPVEAGQRGRLLAGNRGLVSSPRGGVHHGGHGDRGHDVHGEREDVPPRRDAQGVQGSGEEEVEQQRPEHGCGQRRPAAAHQCGGDGQTQEEHRFVRRVVAAPQRHQRDREQHPADRGEQVSDRDPAPGQRSVARIREPLHGPILTHPT